MQGQLSYEGLFSSNEETHFQRKEGTLLDHTEMKSNGQIHMHLKCSPFCW